MFYAYARIHNQTSKSNARRRTQALCRLLSDKLIKKKRVHATDGGDSSQNAFKIEFICKRH